MARVKPPFTVALTGGIASGKTLVSDKFTELGTPVIDSDVLARQLVEPGQQALVEIEKFFGANILDRRGNLRRKNLRELIFTDSEKRKKLESILHPKIRKMIEDAIAKIRDKYCVLVIPLLAENPFYSFIDRVLVVNVNYETQLTRLITRDNLSHQQALNAIASQATNEQRLRIADDILDNSGSPQDLRNKVVQLHLKYIDLADKRILRL